MAWVKVRSPPTPSSEATLTSSALFSCSPLWLSAPLLSCTPHQPGGGAHAAILFPTPPSPLPSPRSLTLFPLPGAGGVGGLGGLVPGIGDGVAGVPGVGGVPGELRPQPRGGVALSHERSPGVDRVKYITLQMARLHGAQGWGGERANSPLEGRPSRGPQLAGVGGAREVSRHPARWPSCALPGLDGLLHSRGLSGS